MGSPSQYWVKSLIQIKPEVVFDLYVWPLGVETKALWTMVTFLLFRERAKHRPEKALKKGPNSKNITPKNTFQRAPDG